MGFFTDAEKKEFFTFFQWEDGKEYQLTIEKEVVENFANGKKEVILHCTDLVTGQKFDRRYEFALMNALNALGDKYVDASTKLLVIPSYQGKTEPNANGKVYDKWTFKVEAAEYVTSGKEEKKAEAPF